jgi:stearoyl-CoA desaturase (delta-9 desaturase)
MAVDSISTTAALDRTPLTVAIAAKRLRGIRIMAWITVIGPMVGTAAALWLAWINGVTLATLVIFAITYALTTLGVTVGFHRYFAHHSFQTSRVMRAIFIVLGSTALQGTMLYWVSTHRRHHQFSDTAGDPHSPRLHDGTWRGRWTAFWHSHTGWLFSQEVSNPARFALDLIRDPSTFRAQQRYLIWAVIGLALPAVAGGLIEGSVYGALEAFLWAGPVRLVIVHNASWGVGSVSHLYGARPFVTRDHSANNLWVALFAFGEGLQNNHHAFPQAAYHSYHWWEPDVSSYAVAALAASGLIWDLHRPSPQAIAAKRRGTGFERAQPKKMEQQEKSA